MLRVPSHFSLLFLYCTELSKEGEIEMCGEARVSCSNPTMADARVSDIIMALDAPAALPVESDTISPSPLTFIQSQKGGRIAVYEFHTFVKNRNLTGDRTYWNCREKQKGGCKGVIVIGSSNNVLSSTVHNHVPNATETAAENAVAGLRKRARKSFTKPRRLHSDLVQDLPLVVSGHLPSANNLARMVRRQRKIQMPVPTQREDIDLESYLEKSELGKDCVLFDSGNLDPNRIIVFKAEDFKYLHEATTWIMDGTFLICPQLFMQLYTIHVELFGGVFPVLFALLPNKTTLIYERLFRVIREVLESMPFKTDKDSIPKPQYIVVDFEKAVINTIGKIFPHTRVQGNRTMCSTTVIRKHFLRNIFVTSN